jgi:hypothetical protein
VVLKFLKGASIVFEFGITSAFLSASRMFRLLRLMPVTLPSCHLKTIQSLI